MKIDGSLRRQGILRDLAAYSDKGIARGLGNMQQQEDKFSSDDLLLLQQSDIVILRKPALMKTTQLVFIDLQLLANQMIRLLLATVRPLSSDNHLPIVPK
jgi:hypothetical protein